MDQKSIFKGALILSLAGVLSKVLGAIYRIPFARLVGDEGVGLYQMAYPFYTLILAISTAGVPLAISKLIAERQIKKDYHGIGRIFKISLLLLFIVGTMFSLGLYFSADFIAVNFFKEPRAALSLKAIAPAIVMTTLMATIRGYFQGFQNMTPTALSQIFEQIIRVTTVFIAAFYLLPLGVEYAAAGATFGAFTGGFASLFLLTMIYFWHNKKNKVRYDYTLKQTDEGFTDITKQIMFLAIPISIGALVLPLMQLLDSFIVPARLQAGGFTTVEATRLYGQLSGMAGAIINLPFIITTALAASLVPAISGLLSEGKKEHIREQFSQVLRLALIIVLPASIGLLVLAEPISILLYNLKEAGTPLAWLAPSIIAIGLYQTSAGALQGLGKPIEPVYSLILAAVIKIGMTYTLTALPEFGIKGAALGTVVAFFMAAIRNLFVVNKELKGHWFKLQDHFIKPGFSVTMMGLMVIFIFKSLSRVGMGNSLNTLISICLGGAIYFLVLLLVGGIRASEIKEVPRIGIRLLSVLRKLKLVRD
ncbi:stage V sporulation protein B [Desulfonispora thiosulfatigenes DSM 11270]|uniref:Stage V sporulation protein B n=1 Tax=Desulfonispora thiosulfatigenes DSM 11270 TaxID=656914 RepID=A0A1W1UZB5_DESTI|nr:polysaccharide biosynthesis protein [Desulfonispora thiosulfatigenes]SMB86458.1 stage V sporulation protein B [Desulfonispora thiosulfatigenes DSM 11270]